MGYRHFLNPLESQNELEKITQELEVEILPVMAMTMVEVEPLAVINTMRILLVAVICGECTSHLKLA